MLGSRHACRHAAGSMLRAQPRWARVGLAVASGVGLGVSVGSASACNSSDAVVQHSAAERPALKRTDVHKLVHTLQDRFMRRLELLTNADGFNSVGDFQPVSWLRDEGRHGGGTRYELQDTRIFNRASINVSSVHYNDLPKYPVKSATALSMIIHPSNPYAPSLHLHVSYMEPRGRPPYWRMIADLNPSIEDPAATNRFEAAMQSAMPATLYADSKLFGERYFYIPDLGRCRGAAHVFVGSLSAGDVTGMSTSQCAALAGRFASSALEAYAEVAQQALNAHADSTMTEADRARQLAYHTLYFFQVLTLDRGTTHGVLAHNQNDVWPCFVVFDISCKPVELYRGGLTRSVCWMVFVGPGRRRKKVSPPRDELVRALLAALPTASSSYGHRSVVVTSETRQALADVLRNYYKTDRKRLAHQASLDLAWWAARSSSKDSAAVGGAAAANMWSNPGAWR